MRGMRSGIAFVSSDYITTVRFDRESPVTGIGGRQTIARDINCGNPSVGIS